MIILIPMAGDSSRFTSIGMAPKYTLKTNDFETLFDASLKSFKKYFNTAKFIIVVKDEYAAQFTESHLKQLGIENFCIKNISQSTRGQAETTYLGLEYEDESDMLVVFNNDTIRRNLDLSFDDEIWDTMFDAFYDESAGSAEWSFCKVDDNNKIIETAEKRKISSWCSTGLYVFRSALLFKLAYEEAITNEDYNYYIAPLYNNLKGMNNILLECPSEDVDFAGTPKQYYEYYDKVNKR